MSRNGDLHHRALFRTPALSHTFNTAVFLLAKGAEAGPTVNAFARC
jgi:hypothetical protein